MKAHAHPLPEVYEHRHGKLADIRAITHDRNRAQEWISTTTTLYNPNDGLVYVGLTHREGDLLYAYDPKTGKATCCNYESIRVKNEVKIHRSLILGPDGRIYGATAGLIDVRIRDESPGGQIWAYNPKAKRYEVYGIPVPHDYIQHVVFDFDRQMAYGCTYPVPWFFAFDMKAKRSKLVSFIGCLPHRSVIDDRGRVWSGWGMSADYSSADNFLICYDPDTNAIAWLDMQLPGVGQKDGKQIDDAINLGDGYLYFGTVNGGFSRLNPDTREIEWIGKPAQGMRLCGIGEGPDGLIYVLTGAFYGQKGEDRKTRVFSFDRKKKQFSELGAIYDPEFGDGCAVVHHLSIGEDGTLWVGETDNDQRSGCLWECRVK
jgi:outer membrane protein assembly factor BamB